MGAASGVPEILIVISSISGLREGEVGEMATADLPDLQTQAEVG